MTGLIPATRVGRHTPTGPYGDAVPCPRCGVTRRVHKARDSRLCESCRKADHCWRFLLDLDGAACKGKAQLWNAVEERLRLSKARQPWRIEDMARPAYQLCAVCPVLDACADWARAEGYTGIAAGRVWDGGTPVRHQEAS